MTFVVKSRYKWRPHVVDELARRLNGLINAEQVKSCVIEILRVSKTQVWGIVVESPNPDAVGNEFVPISKEQWIKDFESLEVN